MLVGPMDKDEVQEPINLDSDASPVSFPSHNLTHYFNALCLRILLIDRGEQ